MITHTKHLNAHLYAQAVVADTDDPLDIDEWEVTDVVVDGVGDALEFGDTDAIGGHGTAGVKGPVIWSPTICIVATLSARI